MTDEFEAPLAFPVIRVAPEWVDYNGHMNVAFYVQAFDHCVDQFLDRLGIGPEAVDASQASAFTLELHINYLREVQLHAPLRITCQLLDHDAKRYHYFLSMYHDTDGYLAATSEQLGIYIDMQTRRSAPFPPAVAARLAALAVAHRELPPPGQAGRSIGIRRPPRGNAA